MRRSPESAPGRESSWLGGALSYEFADCSVVAAAVSKLAGELLDSECGYKDGSSVAIPAKREFRILGEEDEDPQKISCLDVRSVYKSHEGYTYLFEVEDFPANLVLVRPVHIVEEPSVRKRKLLPDIEVKTTKRQEKDPMLGAVIGQDIILPLASFARRKGGHCSYVQLGREMTDDNFYLTPKDDESDRLKFVTAIEKLLESDPRQTYSELVSQETIEKINSLINKQVAEFSQDLHQACEDHLIRSIFKKFGKNSREATLHFISEEAVPERFQRMNIVGETLMSGGRLVSLEVVRPQTGDGYINDRLELVAITRKNVAVPIATMSSRFDKIEFIDHSITKEEKAEIVRSLLYAVDERDSRLEERTNFIHGKYGSSEEIDVARGLYGVGMLQKNELNLKDKLISPGKERIRIKINNYLLYPTPERNPYPKSEAMKIVLTKAELRAQSDRKLLGVLKVEERLGAILGEPKAEEEVFMHSVRWLESLGGVELALVKVKESGRNAVVNMDVKRNQNVYEVCINGRPESMDDEPLRELIKIQVDPTKPSLGIDPDNLASSRESLSEITDYIISAIQFRISDSAD